MKPPAPTMIKLSCLRFGFTPYHTNFLANNASA
jgi:hypothetical protein